MNEKRLRRVYLTGYLVFILYWMFLGFGRPARFDSFRYSLMITGIPLWFPKRFSFDSLQRWIFALGNLAAFIPFGVLIPINLQKAENLFLKSFAAFVAGIALLETAQTLSLLGSFDAEDILVNALGFLIGYASWRFGQSGEKPLSQFLRFCVLCGVLILLTIAGAEIVNVFLR